MSEAVLPAYDPTSPREPADAEMDEQSALARRLMARDPRLPFISALVIAGDELSARRAQQALDGGMAWERAAWLPGSYARLDFVVRNAAAGRVPRAWLLEQWAHLWSGSDPDDTDPRFLALWREMRAERDGFLCDDEAFSPPPGERWTVYRGQDRGAPFGIAWSLDREIARGFARGKATRQANRGGVVYAASIERSRVLGVLLGRGESEVVLDPADLTDVRVVR